MWNPSPLVPALTVALAALGVNWWWSALPVYLYINWDNIKPFVDNHELFNPVFRLLLGLYCTRISGDPQRLALLITVVEVIRVVIGNLFEKFYGRITKNPVSTIFNLKTADKTPAKP